MLKKAKYWRAFTAATRAAAERAATTWWAEQSGFDKISGWTLPAPDAPPGSDPQWTVTIIYRPSEPETLPAALH
jgi:hypothetical protein